MKLKDQYIIANCCKPTEDNQITGYYSHNNIIKIHKNGCTSLSKAESERLMKLNWNDIKAEDDFRPGSDYSVLNELDFMILNHHNVYGVDYSLKVARMLHIDKQKIFDSHTKLRKMKLLERVKELMMQYRKGIVKNKWIKHRNHTYYKLTVKGKNYLEYYQASSKK
jgi:(p)ppGpp synthase/HD superfamily hydrolase